MNAIYTVPRSPAPVDLYLDSNEGARPDPGLLDALDRVDILRRYPDAGPLEVRLARRLGIGPEQVLVTAGGDDAIDRLCRVFLGPGTRLVLPVPGFEMVARYARVTGAEVVPIPWGRASFPVDGALAVEGATAIVVTSPNNPTGAVLSATDLRRLSEGAPDTLLMVDLAYAEFADEDLTEVALSLPNTIVIRTLSKAWGLAGLRVGYALGPAASLERMRAVGPPYAVSGVSLGVALAALDRADSVSAYVDRVRGEREVIFDLLEALGARPCRSEANFVFAEVADPMWVRDALASLGIAIRAFPGRDGLERALRVSCPGDPMGLDRLERALRCALDPQALLFDMDGVLVDVSRSYRVAIRETAAAFGVQLSDEDIEAAKVRGDANNDWVLTRRLLREGGVEVDQARVTRDFEARYQTRLWRRERPLVSRQVLEGLSARLPLAVVTGRPRRDALRFLESAGFADLFEVVVAMEDAPAKPDPAPVRCALDRLGVHRAWMVGDTVDDLRAARAAGVVSVGFGADLPMAARVLGDLAELGRLLCALSS